MVTRAVVLTLHMPLFSCFYGVDLLLFNNRSICSHVSNLVVTRLFCVHGVQECLRTSR